ncbi:uncharacterized protein [Nicotiana tomentosiformis]|uniref:uncharacterized protein n=1 Tax=Nicotiana tomentosiformis TaxID=4098 RepID=UPI00388CD57A
MAEELKKLTSRVQGVKGGKGIEGLNYEDLCIQPDVELPEGYKPPKFEMFDGIGDPKLYERLKASGYVTPIPAVAMENSSQWVNPNKTCIYHSGMKGHTIDECHTLKDKIQTLIDTKVIQAKETAPNVRNNPLPDHRGEGVNVIETDEEWDPEGSIGLIREEDDPKMPQVTLMPIVVQIQSPIEVEDYTAEARRKGKGKMEETGAAQDGGSSLNIFSLTTLKRLGKGLHEIRAGTMNVKAFDGSQRATIRETNLCLQMGPTWFDVEFQVLDISASYNLLLGRPWIHADGAVASTLHQAVKFEWNHHEVIIHEDRSNPIYTNQTVPVVDNRRKLGGETYHRIERVNAIEKDK